MLINMKILTILSVLLSIFVSVLVIYRAIKEHREKSRQLYRELDIIADKMPSLLIRLRSLIEGFKEDPICRGGRIKDEFANGIEYIRVFCLNQGIPCPSRIKGSFKNADSFASEWVCFLSAVSDPLLKGKLWKTRRIARKFILNQKKKNKGR